MTLSRQPHTDAPRDLDGAPLWLSFFLCGFAVLILGTWINYAADKALIADIAFLIEAASRLLDGHSMSESAYDTNPPLNLLLYAPVVWLSDLTALPVYRGAFLYPLLCAFLSAAAVFAQLKHFTDIRRNNILPLSLSYLFALTLLIPYDFGQKDHIIAMAVLPLCLQQILITRGIMTTRLFEISVLLCGSVLILVKPHLGVLPALIFVHRAIWQSRLSVCFDRDFLWLAGMFCAYIASLFLFYGDYLYVIAPDVMRYYMNWAPVGVFFQSIGIIAALNLIGIAACFAIKRENRPLIFWLFALSFAATFSYYVQGRGFDYHLYPAKLFTALAYAALIAGALNRFSPIKSVNALLILTLSAGAFYTFRSDAKTYSHTDYLNSALMAELNAAPCEEPCSFYMFSYVSNIAYELSLYSGFEHATRFPVLWFVSPIVNERYRKTGSAEDRTQELQRFSHMMLEDFARDQPDLLIIGQFPFLINESGEPTDFESFFGAGDEKWRALWDEYTYDKTITINFRDIIGAAFGTSESYDFKIYRKRQTPNEG